MTSDELLEELGALLGRCVKVIRELETENAELKDGTARTEPVKREWVRLTDEEITELWIGTLNEIALGRAIEQALKERNT